LEGVLLITELSNILSSGERAEFGGVPFRRTGNSF
jgi:hypothetical protein